MTFDIIIYVKIVFWNDIPFSSLKLGKMFICYLLFYGPFALHAVCSRLISGCEHKEATT